MPTRNKKLSLKRKWNYITYGALTVIILFFGFLFYAFFPKDVPVSYFVKALDAIGAPEGFIVNPAREHISKTAFEPDYARRTYIGDMPLEALKDQMLRRIYDAGFENVMWRGKTSNFSEGLIATCKGIHIFVGIHQPGDDPIDIEIIKKEDKNAPDCPSL